jgi:AcrR family transcriptional regulator
MPVKKKKNFEAESMRRMALLWDSQTEPGRSGLTVKAIVTAAIEIADARGAEELSMRNVAEKLGVGAMSLYTHIPGKSELIDLMFDTAFGELYARVEEPNQQGSWQAGLRFIARRNWELYRAHPWMLHIIPERPVLGPQASLKYEAELRPLDGLGLSDVEMDASLTLILTHVEGCARAHDLQQRAQQNSGMSDVEWWVTQAPLMERLIEPGRFPVADRVGMTVGEAYQASGNPEFVFTFGLDRILVGIEDLVRNKKQ